MLKNPDSDDETHKHSTIHYSMLKLHSEVLLMVFLVNRVLNLELSLFPLSGFIIHRVLRLHFLDDSSPIRLRSRVPTIRWPRKEQSRGRIGNAEGHERL